MNDAPAACVLFSKVQLDKGVTVEPAADAGATAARVGGTLAVSDRSV